MAKNKNIHKAYLEYELTDTFKVIHYMSIFHNLKDGETVPADVIKGYIKLVKYAGTEEMKQVEAEITTIRKNSINRFCSDDEFNFISEEKPDVKNDGIITFEIGKSENPENKNAEKYSLELMLNEAYNSVMFYYLSKLKSPEPELIQKQLSVMIFHSLTDFCKKLTFKNKEKISPYKRYVLTAFIMQGLGFKFTTKKNPINSELYQGIRYLLDTALKVKSTK